MRAAELIGTSRAARVALVLLAFAACVNVAAGITISLTDPDRAADLWPMYEWCRAWLVGGESLYTGAAASTDYPPNAIVLLSPIALVPQRWLVPLWTVFATALTPVLPWLVLRAAAPRQRAALAVPVLLYLCWAAPRTLLQFSVLSLTLGALALWLAETRPLGAGIALGLALSKPHIAGPIALWMLVTGRIRPLVTAIAVAAAGWAVYDARIGESPLTTAAGLWRVLGADYTGAGGLVGRTSIRGWAQLAASDAATGDAIWIALSAALLAAVCWIAVRARSRRLDEGGMALPALFCLWSLLVIYHNGNNLILMLPAFAFLWFRDDPPGWRHWLPIVVLELTLAYDVPVRLGAMASSAGWGRHLIEHFDRVLVLATLIVVSSAAGAARSRR